MAAVLLHAREVTLPEGWERIDSIRRNDGYGDYFVVLFRKEFSDTLASFEWDSASCAFQADKIESIMKHFEALLADA